MREALNVPPYRVDRDAVATEAAAILRHSDFREALARYSAAGLDRCEGDPQTSKMICQVARYTLALAIFHLDSTAGEGDVGASPARLRAMLTTGRFASAGWVKNAVQVFHRVGYLERKSPLGDRRFKRVAPSARMLAIAEEVLTPMLLAVDSVAPLPVPAGELVRVPGFIGAAASHTIVPYLADGFTPLEAFPEIRVLLHHDFGFLVLCHLIRTMRRTPEGKIVAMVPSVVLSRQFGMSRAQARNVLSICRNAGWIAEIGRGARRIVITPHFADLCERWVAHDLGCWSRVVSAACSDLGLRQERPTEALRNVRFRFSAPLADA
jgi:hypothetical protein